MSKEVLLYVPKTKIAIASSFEGIFNNGATECALVSLNAYNNQDPEAFFGRKLSAREFIDSCRDSTVVKAFLALRPMVAVAEDYRTILDLINSYKASAETLADHPNDIFTYSFFEGKFNEVKEKTKTGRDAFGKGKESFFYKERETLQKASYDDWLNTQEPYADTIPQFRALVDTQEWDGDVPVRGFFPRFATSKDEQSTHALCLFYAKVMKLDPSDVEGRKCIVPRDGIIGMETVPSRDKVEQLTVIANRLELPRENVWRVEDRYDPKQFEKLHEAGFVHNFLLPGYATPREIEKAIKDGIFPVFDRGNFATQLASYAEANGF
jgi:hypothetical protein